MKLNKINYTWNVSQLLLKLFDFRLWDTNGYNCSLIYETVNVCDGVLLLVLPKLKTPAIFLKYFGTFAAWCCMSVCFFFCSRFLFLFFFCFDIKSGRGRDNAYVLMVFFFSPLFALPLWDAVKSLHACFNCSAILRYRTS